MKTFLELENCIRKGKDHNHYCSIEMYVSILFEELKMVMNL